MTSQQADFLDGAYTPRATQTDDGESPYIYTTTTTTNNKKPKLITPNSSSSFEREEWSDVAISTLLDSCIEKCKSRFGNFRVKDWEEVAASVNEMCERAKSVDRCKNKVDNLKKRFKVERIRVGSDGESESRWPWFRKMESIVGDFVSVKRVSCDEKFGGGRAK
nr:aspartate/glutamate/uridylate kinase [Tanacetum cinerariifolium]